MAKLRSIYGVFPPAAVLGGHLAGPLERLHSRIHTEFLAAASAASRIPRAMLCRDLTDGACKIGMYPGFFGI
jgi:hypothetical protein